ncbi:DUF1178 family protein [Asaia krungthepensis]|uniref:DUF1178 domain-containing protein n=1 Tax=Asaia krungthepensis NRIC 0535 TaxID=1307925 RepID=A0ABQ0Q1J2_9PROT|nr:DUF1178 family protein [Asaia krungthepensis]GBQ86877.1 hypothetical protein AA0535_1138 [Asaia krungthepensis NRIC 0535]
MICYRLHCATGHEFEGWFPSGEAFDRQRDAALVTCPVCGVTEIAKSLMAPAVAKTVETPPLPAVEQIRQALRRLRKEVEAQCDNVGTRFAEEALKRHDAGLEGDRQSARGIYGTMSDTERERLEDEGVDFTPVPWIDLTEN